MLCCNAGYHEMSLDWVIKTVLKDHKTMEEFLEKWGTELPETVKEELQKMVEDGTFDEIITEGVFPEFDRRLTIMENNVVNVIVEGVVADGSDQTAKIQKIINSNPGKTIFFPDGEYGINDTITTKADGVNANTVLLLTPNAVLRALPGLNGKFMFHLGADGVVYDGAETFKNNGIIGGVLDCSWLSSGIRVSNLQKVNINSVLIVNDDYTGIQVYGGEETWPADTTIENVIICGNPKSNVMSTIAIDVYGTDCKILNVRTIGSYYGVRCHEGGTFLNNVHPVCKDSGSLGVNYNNSVGFECDLDQSVTYMTQCYADNFAVGFYAKNGARIVSEQSQCYWYSGGDYRHWGVMFDDDNYDCVFKQFHYSTPDEGDNKLLVYSGLGSAGKLYYYMFAAKNYGAFEPVLEYDDWQRLDVNDLGLASVFNGVDYNELYDGTNIVSNKWYALSTLINFKAWSSFILEVQSSNFMFQVFVKLGDDSIESIDVLANKGGYSFELALSKTSPIYASDICECYDIYIRCMNGTPPDDFRVKVNGVWCSQTKVERLTYKNKGLVNLENVPTMVGSAVAIPAE